MCKFSKTQPRPVATPRGKTFGENRTHGPGCLPRFEETQTNPPWAVRARASNWMIKLVKTGLTALTYNTKTTHFRSRRCMHA